MTSKHIGTYAKNALKALHSVLLVLSAIARLAGAILRKSCVKLPIDVIH